MFSAGATGELDDRCGGLPAEVSAWVRRSSALRRGHETMVVVAEKPEKPFMTKGAERVLVWSFLIPIILLVGTFIVLAIAR